MPSFNSILRELRTKAGLSQQQLADKIGISKSSINMYERGEREPGIETLEAFADFFNVDMNYLLGKIGKPTITLISTPTGRRYLEGDEIHADTSVTMYVDPNDPEQRKMLERMGFLDIRPQGVRIPVYGSVAAGIPLEAIQDIEDYEEITEDMARSGKYAALKIKGNSMLPRFTPGDVVIVRLQDDVDNGDIAIVIVNGDEATCKKIKKTPEGVMLISTNPDYEPMFYSNQEIAELPVRIWGKVVELRAKF